MLIGKVTSWFFPSLVKGVPVTYSKARKKREISFEQLYHELQEKGFKEVTREFNIRASKSKKVYIDWGHAIVAEAPVALGTNGINTCSALKLIDPTSDDLHYMLHAYPDTEPSDIAKSLRKAHSLGMNLKDSEIEIMPGDCLNSESTPHILEAIYKVNSSLIDKVMLIQDPKLRSRAHSQALVTYDGKTYRYPDDFPSSHEYRHPSLSKDGYKKVL